MPHQVYLNNVSCLCAIGDYKLTYQLYLGCHMTTIRIVSSKMKKIKMSE